ncbi:MAG TPA: glycosyltransferase family 2 protein [Chitinophagaceae bacterium]|nr:glycosyltransferase family 2 protein [Chitinophagaceae bacterium]
MHSSVFIVIPVYNEAPVIAQTLHQAVQTGYSIVVVDDGSTDGTTDIVRSFPVHCIVHPVNLGQGAALQTGMEFAKLHRAQAVVHFDADGQHRTADVDKLLSPILQGKCDVVFGSRFLQGGTGKIPRAKRMSLQLARYVNWMFTGILLSDAHNGLRALNRRALEEIQLSESRMSHATEILWIVRDKGLSYTEVPVTIEYTAYSMHKGQSLWNSINIIFDLLFKKINR